MMRTPFLPALAALALLAACRRPDPLPQPWEAAVAEAAGREPGCQGLPEEGQAAFRQGFLHGATMVRNAVRERMVPTQVALDWVATEAVPKGKLPEGVTVTAGPARVEADPGTGFPFAGLMPVSGADPQAVLRGFDWAVHHHRAELEAAGLLRPLATPAFPHIRAWIPWPADRPQLRAESPGAGYALERTPGALRWEYNTKGFAPIRAWRPMDPGQTITLVAPEREVLWVNLANGQALALDRQTGLIRAAREGVSLEAYERAMNDAGGATPDLEQRLVELRKKADAGDAPSMLALSHALRRRDPKTALALLWQASKAGLAEAMVHLADALLRGGLGSPVDPIQARTWMEKAAGLGNEEARLGLQLFGTPK